MFKKDDLVKIEVRPVETYAVEGSDSVPVFIYPEQSETRFLTGKIKDIFQDWAEVRIDGADWNVEIPVSLLKPQ